MRLLKPQVLNKVNGTNKKRVIKNVTVLPVSPDCIQFSNLKYIYVWYNYSGDYRDSVDLIGQGLRNNHQGLHIITSREVIIAGALIFKMAVKRFVDVFDDKGK